MPQTGGYRNPTLLADACEAAIGAVRLDGGLDWLAITLLRRLRASPKDRSARPAR